LASVADFVQVAKAWSF